MGHSLAHAHQLVEQATRHSVSDIDKLVDTLDLAVTTHLPGLSLSLYLLLACPRSLLCASLSVVAQWQGMTHTEVAAEVEVEVGVVLTLLHTRRAS